MMLPQYVDALEAEKETVEQPKELDEQLVEEMNRILGEAKRRGIPLRVKAHNGTTHYVVIGRVKRVDPLAGWIQIQTAAGAAVKVPLHTLQDIQWDSEFEGCIFNQS